MKCATDHLDKYYYTQKVRITQFPLYLIIMVPPYMGSSALENLLASSPHVTTMCKKTKWQCESTWNLCDEGILDCAHRWDPKSTDWVRAYEYFNRIEIWDNMSKNIRLDKSPPNIVKYRELIAYFEQTNSSYMFVAMIPDRCYVSRHHYSLSNVDRQLEYMRQLIEFTDPKHIVQLNYTDMLINTNRFITRLLDAIPELEGLDIVTNNIHIRRMLADNYREQSLYDFITSDDCKIQNYCPSSSPSPPLPLLLMPVPSSPSPSPYPQTLNVLPSLSPLSFQSTLSLFLSFAIVALLALLCGFAIAHVSCTKLIAHNSRNRIPTNDPDEAETRVAFCYL